MEYTIAPSARLEYLRGELRAERISYGELHELQGMAQYIDPGDVELLEAAGVEEFGEGREQQAREYAERRQLEYEASPAFDYGSRVRAREKLAKLADTFTPSDASTARPWGRQPLPPDMDGGIGIYSANDKLQAIVVNESGGDLIVQAVNSFDGLVEAAQQALRVIYDDDPATAKAIELLRAALRLAGKGAQ